MANFLELKGGMSPYKLLIPGECMYETDVAKAATSWPIQASELYSLHSAIIATLATTPVSLLSLCKHRY